MLERRKEDDKTELRVKHFIEYRKKIQKHAKKL